VRDASVVFVALLLVLVATACTPRAPERNHGVDPVVDDVAHDVYVWRGNITDDLRAEMRAAAPHVGRFKVLAREHDGAARVERMIEWRASDFAATPPRDVVLVWRFGGVVDETLDVRPLVQRATALRAHGVRVTGIEIDHDCPTRALPRYAQWLQATRAHMASSSSSSLSPSSSPRLQLLVTALPTWASNAEALRALAAVVDGITVQVHMVKAPTLFDVDEAARDLDRFATALSDSSLSMLRVALPTYRATLANGAGLSVTLDEVRRFRALRPWPRVSWFRLGAADDVDAWGAATLVRAIAGDEAPTTAAAVRLRPTSDALVFDVVVDNPGTVDVDAPSRISLVGADSADGLGGYAAVRDDVFQLVQRAPPRLRPGASLVVGWARGSGVVVAP
jgi:hypothetical protein